MVKDKELRDELWDVLNSRRRIFRNFKDTLPPDELNRYYDFIEERNRKRMMEWLETNVGVKVIIEDQ